MSRFFKNTLAMFRRHPILEAAAMSGAAILLVLAAVFVSQGGMSQVNALLAMYGITPESQTGCVFPCNNTGYNLQALIPMQGGVPVSTVLPGTSVDWIWNAGEYYGNNFYPVCKGRTGGYAVDCSVTLGSAPANLGTSGSCSAGWTEPGTCAEYACSGYDKNGACAGSYCASYYPDVYHPAVGCNNADIYFGWNTYGPSGGYPPNYASPGYAGNTPGTLVMTAPSTPGTYTYNLCSAWLIWYTSHGNAGCFGTTLTVASPPPTCTLTPASQSINQTQSSSWTYSTNAYTTGITYKVDGGTAITPAGNPFSVSGGGLSVGSHSVIMTATGPGGSATCGASGNLTVTAAPGPSCTLTPIVSTNTAGNYSYATFSYSSANAVSTTYAVDGGAAITPGNNPFNVTGLAAGAHGVIMTVTNSVGATATCGSANNVTTGALAAPTVAITAGGASSVTVPVNGTTTLAWSTSNAAPGSASVTAPSSSGTATNFAAITTGTANGAYAASYVKGNGYVYQMGGNSGSYSTALLRAPLSSDLTSSANWTSLGTVLPSGFVHFTKPVVLGGTMYLFGGLNSTGTAWVSQICSVPLTNIATGPWDCSAASMPGAYSLSDVVIIGNYLYRFGGYTPDASGSQSSVERAPVSSPLSWTNFPSVLPQAIYGSAVAIVGNYVYLLGGYNSINGPRSTIYRALITSDLTVPSSWSSAGTLAQATYLGAVVVDATYAYMVGGYSSSGTSIGTIYRSTLSSLAGGAPVWTGIATLPTAQWQLAPILMDNTLYLAGGYNSTTPTPVNKIASAPFNAGFAYTSPTMLPWQTDGTNYAVTWPITVPSVTYTLSATNAAGTSNATAVVNKPDLCTNTPFTGVQNPLPANVTAVGTTCSCTAGAWDGSSCAAATPPTMSVTPSINGGVSAISRVRKGNTVSLYWNVTGLIINDAGTTCTLSSSPAGAMSTQTWDRTTATWTQGASPPSATINATTVFVLACSNASYGTATASASVGTLPTYIEQ